jgi:hypothetical protein
MKRRSEDFPFIILNFSFVIAETDPRYTRKPVSKNSSWVDENRTGSGSDRVTEATSSSDVEPDRSLPLPVPFFIDPKRILSLNELLAAPRSIPAMTNEKFQLINGKSSFGILTRG